MCAAIKLRPELEKYCVVSADGSCIERFVCPVDGCGYSTEVPEELRMHVFIASDPSGGRFSPRHFAYFDQREDDLNMENIKYLSQFHHHKFETNI